ncbi:MAG: DUF11 domain-containing protein [Erythrobacter sp.]
MFGLQIRLNKQAKAIAKCGVLFAFAVPLALLAVAPASAQNQTTDTSNGNACVDAGGTLGSTNLFTIADNGSFGTGSGAANEIPPTNPYAGEITGGVYRPSYATFPHGSFTIISNQVTRRNNSQFNGTQVDPVNGVNGRFFVSDPEATSPLLNTELTGLVPGQSYEISFWVADSERDTNGDKQSMAVVIDSDIANPVFVTDLINSNGGNNANNPVVWQLWSFVYTHTANTTTIDFGLRANLTGSSGRDIFLDEISVNTCQLDADLVTQKTLDSGASATPDNNDTVTFDITVTNNGPGVANNVTLTDLIPSGLTPTSNNGDIIGDTFSSGGSYNATSGVWSAGRLAAGDSITLTVEGTVDPDLLGETVITNTTTAATSDNDDPEPTGNDLTESVTIASDPDLSITKVADDDELVTVGQQVLYTYVVVNTGNTIIRDVSIGDVHNGFGPAPTPGNEIIQQDQGTAGDTVDASQGGSAQDGVWDQLGPGDTIAFTGTYTVTQTDIDNLQ